LPSNENLTLNLSIAYGSDSFGSFSIGGSSHAIGLTVIQSKIMMEIAMEIEIIMVEMTMPLTTIMVIIMAFTLIMSKLEALRTISMYGFVNG
jgi:hypothetical protein